MKQLLLYCSMIIVLTSCGSNKHYSAQENEAYQNLQELVASRSFEIISNTASPLASAAFNRVANSKVLGPGNNANNIDISANGNKLTIKGDTIQGYLPFFGDQNFGSAYNGNHSGIEFDNVPQDYKVSTNDRKHTVDIQFRIDDKYRNNEHYNIMITLYSNYRSTINVQSSNRSSIEYRGRFNKWTSDKK